MTETVTAHRLHEWMNAGDVILIDVREPGEYRAEHIEGAILMPLLTLSVDRLAAYRGKKIIFQCKSGKRGHQACEKIQKMRSPLFKIYNLEGGITAWTEAGYPTKKTGRFFLPLDRQVQLMIGFCVLTSSLLAAAISPAFLFLTGFFGLGLLWAGLTGFCGLARLLARMPWNAARP